MFSLDALFCNVDDFCKAFEAQWYKKLLNHGGRKGYIDLFILKDY